MLPPRHNPRRRCPNAGASARPPRLRQRAPAPPRLLTVVVLILAVGTVAIGIWYIVRRVWWLRAPASASEGMLTWFAADGRRYERRLPSASAAHGTAYIVYYRAGEPGNILLLRTADTGGFPLSSTGLTMVVAGLLVLLCHATRNLPR